MIQDPDGVVFSSIPKMCEAHNANYSTFMYYRKKDLSVKESLSLSKGDQKIVYDHKGNQFNSIADMCTHWGVKYATYCARRRNNHTVEESLTSVSLISTSVYSRKLDKTFDSVSAAYNYFHPYISLKAFLTKFKELNDIDATVEFYLYKREHLYSSELLDMKETSLSEIYREASKVKELPISYLTFINYVKNGLSVDDALQMDRKQGPVSVYSKELNRKFNSLQEAYNYFNISVSGGYFREVYNQFNDIDATVKYLTSNRRKTYQSDKLGIKDATINTIYKEALKVKPDLCSYSTFNSLIKSGMSIDEALTQESAPQVPEFTYHGKTYSSITVFSEYAKKTFGISPTTLFNRLRHGWEIDEALGLIGKGLDFKLIKGLQPNTQLKVISIHFNGTAMGKRSVFEVIVKETGEKRYMFSEQIQQYPKYYIKAPF